MMTQEQRPQNQTAPSQELIGYSPVYAPLAPGAAAIEDTPPRPKPSGIKFEGLDIAIMGGALALVAAVTWAIAGSYHGRDALARAERAEERLEAATALAEQLQGITEQQGYQIQGAKDALGCLPGGGPNGH